MRVLEQHQNEFLVESAALFQQPSRVESRDRLR